MKYSQYDIVILGSGLAGLYLANRLCECKDLQYGILLITKEDLYSGSTCLAQGGIVGVIPEFNKNDSIESHIKDTIKAGCGLNNISTVKYVSENSYIAIQELMKYGVEFDRNPDSSINFTLEGAHSKPRILHCNGDSTGDTLSAVLSKRIQNNNNIDIYKNCMALKILTDSKNCCRGLIAYHDENNEYEAIYSNNVVIATGGIGRLYKKSTNPSTSTSDGIALAHDAGCTLENMEFVQFHPTGLYTDSDTTPLISESVRGEGAKLVNANGDYFAKNYHPMADLAPRDVIARAITNEIEQTKTPYVFLDISQIGLSKFKSRFPTITKLCQDNNIDISNMLIPVAPCQHYFMGGIKVDLNSKTSIDNLYAIGECASTGLHGANRLASNSLLECAVFAHKLADNLLNVCKLAPKMVDEKVKKSIDEFLDSSDDCYDEINYDEIFNKLKDIMTNYAGVMRDEKGLEKALEEIFKLKQELKAIYSKKGYELKNALNTSEQIVISALNRKNSIGAHYRADFPQSEPIVQNIEVADYDKLLA